MGLFSGWFKKSEPEDYEQILASLALDIQKRQTRLSEIRLRERRATLVVTLYAIAAWGAYGGLWYVGFLPNLSNHRPNSQFERALKGLPTVIGPILILFTRRIVQLWYARIGDAEEKSLKKLYAEQRTKVEEIKKKTNYYSTRNLIEKYDEGSPLRPSKGPAPAPAPKSLPVTPQRGPNTPGKLAVKGPPTTLQTPVPPGLQSQLSPATPQQPVQPPRKQWYDKLADALLGDDEPAADAAASRYALICQKCFAHNGLVKESMWEDAQYVCPKCGHFNPSARALKSGGASPLSPFSPTSPPGTAQNALYPTPASARHAAPAPSPLRAYNVPPSPDAHSGGEERHDEPTSMDVDADS
ncbi:hypothetical protein FA95DRAFT_1500719 [Auriscalpium vulgare]|uniref:Uncharacterized protein n=1 Tax=Auriscalpium vulgare TaxID=40419 RepID=A0ACB8RD94_9AGAM|nr:hypothetical protein FA95DRAFT_1500719 [Auriscalpium vulgare]